MIPLKYRPLLLNGLSALLLGAFTLACFQWLDDARMVDQAPPPAYTPQDKASDLMLPSLFVTEAYLLCFELGAATEAATQQRLVQQLRKLRDHYAQSYQYWAQALPAQQQALPPQLSRSHQSALQLNRLALGPFSEAVQQGRRAELQPLMADLTVLFEQHRRDLNEAVQEVRDAQQNGQDTLARYIKQQRFWAGVELVIASVLSVLLAHALQQRVLQPLSRRLWPQAAPLNAELTAPASVSAPRHGGEARADALEAWRATEGAQQTSPNPGPEPVPEAALAGSSAPLLSPWADALDLMVVGVDRAGRIALFNHAAERFSGRLRRDVLGQRWLDLSAPLQRGSGAAPAGARGHIAWHCSAVATEPTAIAPEAATRLPMPATPPLPPVHSRSTAPDPALSGAWGEVVQLHVGFAWQPPDDHLGEGLPQATALGGGDPAPAPPLDSGVLLQDLGQALRGPLQTVLGMSALGLRAPTEAVQRHYLRRIHLAGQWMTDALEETLDRVQIENASLLLQKQPFCLLDTLDDLLTSTVEQADEKGLQLRQRVHETVTTALVGDPTRLVEVLSQLVDNSLRSEAPGDVQIQVQTLSETEHEVNLQFEVIDQATAQEDPKINALLAHPVQPQALTPAPGETLYITHRLVGLMRGQLWVERAADQTRHFGFSAVFGRASLPQIQQLTSSITLRPSRVLVFDTDPDACEVLEQVMGAWQMQVQCCARQGQAWKALKEACQEGQAFQTLLITLRPGDADALDWLKRLQDQPDLGAQLNLVAVTTGSRQALLDAAQAHGLQLDQVLKKPIRQHRLLSTLRQLPLPAATVQGAGHGGSAPPTQKA